MLQHTLQALGLSETEIKVYLALLPLGTVPASTAGLRVNIPRSTAKYTCEQLEKKGLLSSQNKNNTFFYTARDPETLYGLIRKEKQQTEKKENDLDRMMGNLKELFRADLSLPKVRFFEGPESIIQMFDDVLKERQPIYGSLYVGNIMNPEISSYINEAYIPERQRIKNPAWMLFNDTQAGKDYQQKDMAMNRISLLVPEETFPFDICFHIYGNKVAFYSYKKADFIGVLIEDKHIRNMQFSLFKMAWNFARSLPVNKKYAKVDLV